MFEAAHESEYGFFEDIVLFFHIFFDKPQNNGNIAHITTFFGVILQKNVKIGQYHEKNHILTLRAPSYNV